MDQKKTRKGIDRRQFLKSSAGTIAVASTLAGCMNKQKTAAPAATVARSAKPSANEKFVLGIIGTGDLGRRWHMGHALLPREDVEIAAVCDVDANHRNLAAQMVNERRGKRVQIYKDFRKLVEQKDLDAVLIATCDHWHTQTAIAAIEAGLDVYCEKPLTLTVNEGKELVAAARRYGTVFQTGSQQRSDPRFRQACELVRNGKIGQLKRIDTVLHAVGAGNWTPPQTPPDELDWNFWLGQAPYEDYHQNQVHYQFRWFYDYSGGVMTDWGAHHNDIAQWGNDSSLSGPVSVDGTQVTFNETGPHTVPAHFDVKYKYGNGVELVCHTDPQDYADGTHFGNGVKFTGTDGWVFVSRSEIQASNPELLKWQAGAGDVQLYASNNHHQNFFDCIRSRERCICDVEIGHRSVSVCHIGNISMRLGRALQWDPVKQEFVNDEAANKMLYRPMRAPWHLA